MIPLKDENPTSRPAVVTLLLIGTCVVIYFFVQPAGQGALLQKTAEEQLEEIEFTVRNAAIPCEVIRGRPLTEKERERTFEGNDTTACDAQAAGPLFAPGKNVYLAVLYSMFLHGGLVHLGGNMLFLWVFGNNIEDRMRPAGYVLFYLAGGLAATLAHIAVQPESSVPVVGASGAIAAVMGAYLVLFPNAPILTLVIFYLAFLRDISAKWLLGFWFVSQFLISPNSGVAWMAHVGGFVFGALVALVLRDKLRPPPARRAWVY